jgi:hypothetical protein
MMLPARPAPRLEQPQRLEGVSQQGDKEILHPKDNAHPAGAVRNIIVSEPLG